MKVIRRDTQTRADGAASDAERELGLLAAVSEFDEEYYRDANPDVARSSMTPIEHYVKYGCREGRDPIANFNPSFRGQQRQAYIELRDSMDLSHYRSQLKDETELPDDALAAHYLVCGWKDLLDPSPDFSTEYYLQENSDIETARINPFLHYLRYGKNEIGRRAVDTRSASIFRRFDKGTLASTVAYAKSLDPMVAFPRTAREVTTPALSDGPAASALSAIRADIKINPGCHLVLVPHVRMSGAARVAGSYVQCLVSAQRDASVLVLITDLDVVDYPEFFPDGVGALSLPTYMSDLEDRQKERLLVALLRGLAPKTVTNVNSRLAWDTFTVYGEQLKKEFSISSFLFCADLDAKGDQAGYPVQWLRQCYGMHDKLWCDSEFLASDLRKRFGYPNRCADRVEVIRTPALGRSGGTSGGPKGSKQRRVMWAGRFDRQKRPALMLEIARLMGDVEFWVYGKSVLGDESFEVLDNVPSNVRFMGSYRDLRKEPLDYIDAFLYTSLWDGVPTILLDIGEMLIPIIATNVGGVGELIDDVTGWPVPSEADAPEYVEVLTRAFTNPDLATARALCLSAKIQSEFSEVDFCRRVVRWAEGISCED